MDQHNHTEENIITDVDEDNYGHKVYYYAYACCGQEVTGDPVADRADYLADMAVSEALGK